MFVEKPWLREKESDLLKDGYSKCRFCENERKKKSRRIATMNVNKEREQLISTIVNYLLFFIITEAHR
jgi:hypothetical protein